MEPVRQLRHATAAVERAWAARTSTVFNVLPLLSVRRLLALLVLVTAMPLLLMALVMSSSMVATERQNNRVTLLSNARSLAALVGNEIDTHLAVSIALATSSALQTGDLSAFKQQAIQALAVVPGAWINIADPSGQILMSTLVEDGVALPMSGTHDLMPQMWASRQHQVSDVMLGQLSKRQNAFLVVPVFKDGKPLYTIDVGLNPDRFLALLHGDFGSDVVVGVVDSKANFVARIPNHAASVGTPASAGWRAAMARSAEGFSENLSLEGEDIVTPYAKTKHGWTVGIGYPRHVTEAPARRLQWQLGLVGAALTLASLALGYATARRISASMATLLDAARQVGSGSIVAAQPLAVREANEIIEVLSTASQELVRARTALDQLNSGLEAKVAERTAELSAEMQRREALDAQVRQMQKLDAIGQLTGGIAHDFNNMMAVILSSHTLLERRLARGDSDVAPFLAGIRSGAERAAILTSRLLAFSRQQPLAPQDIDANKVISGMTDIFRRTLPENISIETVFSGGLWWAHADSHELENVLLNLVVNARDAMPDGGKLTIETSNAHLDDAYARGHLEVSAGQYVLIAVSDTGDGMSPEIIARVFEPFFTTKPVGKGTGLGLAQVFGFVKQSGGHVKIYSEVGHGVTIKVYLPRMNGNAPAFGTANATITETILPMARAHETILVVEDDADLRKLTLAMLRELNYRPLEAATSAQALELIEANPDIKLLFTDVVMPDMNGRKLADEAKRRKPGLPVLFTTGYTQNAIVHNGTLDRGVELLMKPFTLDALARKIDRVLHLGGGGTTVDNW